MQILLKLAEILTFTNQAYFRRIYVESSQYNKAWIFLPICNDKLTFDEEAFLSFVFLDMPTCPIQCAKKVVSDSPGLVDFAIGLVNSVFNLPDGQVMFFEEFE